MKQYEMVFTAELTFIHTEDEIEEDYSPECPSDENIKQVADDIKLETRADHVNIIKSQCFTHEVDE